MVRSSSTISTRIASSRIVPDFRMSATRTGSGVRRFGGSGVRWVRRVRFAGSGFEVRFRFEVLGREGGTLELAAGESARAALRLAGIVRRARLARSAIQRGWPRGRPAGGAGQGRPGGGAGSYRARDVSSCEGFARRSCANCGQDWCLGERASNYGDPASSSTAPAAYRPQVGNAIHRIVTRLARTRPTLSADAAGSNRGSPRPPPGAPPSGVCGRRDPRRPETAAARTRRRPERRTPRGFERGGSCSLSSAMKLSGFGLQQSAHSGGGLRLTRARLRARPV